MKSSGDRTDLLLGTGTLIVATIVTVAAWRLPPALYDPLGPSGLPLVTSLILAILAVALIVRWLRARRAASSAPGAERERSEPLAKAIVSIALLAIFVGLIESRLVGFREATFVLFLAMSLLFKRQGWRGLLVTTLCGLLLSYGGYWLFTEVLIVNLPG